ncbi:MULTISPECIES: hypothetical protein [Acidovorax]|uniref:DUF1484 family protein n=1 Tax=Acidovorax facilis TaxID=12917 RepID=A0ABV8DCC4_9BURK|nr:MULTISPECIES: hypothetical protein [Acidovorax]KQB60032.1 hypothetical protein AE621_07210 [Acidovorax sp. SD340]MBO1007480.1 hypothetical protein [Acidovorax sp. SD340]MCO4241329.1 hypothetical protein [Acidovorax facilis]
MNQAQEKPFPASHEEAVVQVATLADELLTQCELHHHNVGLSALLTAFSDLAARNPCCIQGSANQAMSVAMKLARRASEVAPHGAPIH